MVSKLIRILLAICCLGFLSRTQTQTALANAIQGRIISGSPAGPGQFPWQVILKRDEIDDLLCGGSIIASDWVLTAAHCTYGLSSIYLVFGTIQLDDSTALSMTSTELFIHPNYSDATLNNDVSLIKLPSPLPTSASIKPIPLVSSSQMNNNFIGTVATITGFGVTDDEYLDYSQNLLYAKVDIIDNSQCSALFGTSVVIASTLCAKGDAGSNMSICSGDSGGPLVAPNANGDYVQIGINSFVAEDRCTEGYPSGYVRLTSFLDFIQTTTGNTFN